MRQNLIAAVQYAFFLGLGLVLLWYSSRNLTDAEISMMKQSIQGAQFWIAIPAALVFLASHYSRALRWKILMEPLGFHPSSKNTFIAVMLSYFFNLLVPRLGEVMKCTILAKYEKAPVDKLVGTMVAERAVDVISLFIVFFITLFLQVDLLG
ncbi:MAG: lysylphosphatidylglycerol synthase transmembrane domain-containing protein, partial [Sphingobacteriales bacterium]